MMKTYNNNVLLSTVYSSSVVVIWHIQTHCKSSLDSFGFVVREHNAAVAASWLLLNITCLVGG